ncbi:MAG: S-layer homology domain-containing protein, partial [Candidatus Gracilibacteria bacterium]
MDIATGLKKVRQGVASISLATMLVSMLLTGVAQAAVANYNDVPAGAWYYTPVMTIANAAIVDGPSALNNYNYNPTGVVNRAMMTKFAVLAAKFTLVNPATPSFKDEDKAAWYYPYVETAAAHGVVSGYKDISGTLTGNFGPGDSVTREQAAKILVNAFSLAAFTPVNASFPDVNPTMWSYSFIETARHWSVLKGNPDGTFKPFNNINRAELAQMVVGAMNPVALVDQPPAVAGALTVALASDTAKGTTLPSNATSVSLMKVNFVAATSDVKINGLTIHKSGVSALPSAFQGYLYNGNDRLTSGKSFSGTTDDMVFTNLNLSISKGNTLALTFKGDMGDVTTTGNVQFQVKAVDSTAASVGGLPVTSSEFALSTTDVGSVTITKNGTVTNPKVGEDGVTIAKFKIAAATEAANIQQLGLYLAGTITTTD